MRRKGRSKGDLFIDLTSLLDVIFIILLIVLSNYENKAKEADQRQDEADAQYRLYQDQLETADSVRIISIYSTYHSSNRKEREIHVLEEGKRAPDSFHLSGENTEEPMRQFQEKLEDCIRENPEWPVILSFNEEDEKILYKDDKAIRSVLEELKKTYPNTYIK